MKQVDLSGTWRLVREKTNDSYDALVPGDTISALVTAGALPEPYYADQELQAQWVGREDWRYEREFAVEASALDEEGARERMFIHFDSLDTCAEVHVNGTLVGKSDNMFVRRRFSVGRAVRPGKNLLSVTLRSPELEALKRAKASAYPHPYSEYPIQSPHRNLLRKVQCHGGWDWGPCLMVSGIYGSAYLDAPSGPRIDYVRTRQRRLKEGAWRLDVTVELLDPRQASSAVEAKLFGPVPAKKPGRETGASALAAASATARFRPGEHSTAVALSLEIPKAELWWPSGYGAQPLYDLVVDCCGTVVRKRIGFRELVVVSKDDRRGRSMVFRVNGRDVFCKGANWIPVDALPERQGPEVYRRLLESAKEANMNMLRVWGGGQYESDLFYDLCDELGILIWHDFMFSCATYPADRVFLAGVTEEVTHQVKRLQDHPSLALWCGNNENLGALTWFDVTRKDRDRYVVDYDRLYEGTIGNLVEAVDPDRTFWPSSPSGGRGDYSDNWHDDTKGDMHYWSVWHEGKPFDAYYDVTPRFCSEFGFQSFPSFSTVSSFTPPDQLNLTSPVLEHHQRNRRGNTIIIESLSRYFRFPEGLEQMLYMSQVQQAFAIRTAVEYWRSQRPVCMGSLFWQLNDNWPVASWASIEHSGKWKLLHYDAKRFFSPFHVLGFVKGGALEVWGCNDTESDLDASCTIQFLDFLGKSVKRETHRARLAADSSVKIFTAKLSELDVDPRRAFLHLTLDAPGIRSSNDLFLTYPKECSLAKAAISAEVGGDAAGPYVELSSDVPAFFVSLDCGELPGHFEDNCLTLLPGASRRVRYIGASDAKRIKRTLTVSDLRGSYR